MFEVIVFESVFKDTKEECIADFADWLNQQRAIYKNFSVVHIEADFARGKDAYNHVPAFRLRAIVLFDHDKD